LDPSPRSTSRALPLGPALLDDCAGLLDVVTDEAEPYEGALLPLPPPVPGLLLVPPVPGLLLAPPPVGLPAVPVARPAAPLDAA